MIAAVIIKLLLADFAASGKPHLNLAVHLANFLINLSLNLLLIPRIGILGAALASSISYGAAAILALVIYRQSNRASLRSLLLIRRNDFRLLRNIRSRNREN
ncbi:MAG: polysaccharide biosynthesis C-terminal domain-containing protein [Calditrichaeota bacterium]|nr:polysaccharide biosynthesis C-terminal domain-containing protein [Calditrichota bacterium]MCB9068183.1 polysaccharide biosynthesis C-terminal domain-containing protein [Calditrichia bacterium]